MKLPPGYVPGSGAHKATAYGGFGEKLLKQMGWEDGQGLGRGRKGRTKAIEVKIKEDTVGVRDVNEPTAFPCRLPSEPLRSRCRLAPSPHSPGRTSGGSTPSTPARRR